MDDIVRLLFICSGTFFFLYGAALFIVHVCIPYLLDTDTSTRIERRWSEEFQESETTLVFDEEYDALYESLLSTVEARSNYEH